MDIPEPLRSRQSEGGTLSRSTPEAVQKICVSVKNAEESIKTLKDTLPGGVGGAKWGKVEEEAEKSVLSPCPQTRGGGAGLAHPTTGTCRIVEQPRSRRLQHNGTHRGGEVNVPRYLLTTNGRQRTHHPSRQIP